MTRTVQRHLPRRAGTLEDRVLAQAGRELLLAQSSDWPFIITNGTTEEYAKRRFNDHVNRFHDLLNHLDQGDINTERLDALEYLDAVFPELDYRLFAPAGA
jgi:1,4-alpha-glucan branching enzyme